MMKYQYLLLIIFVVGYGFMAIASYFDDNNKQENNNE